MEHSPQNIRKGIGKYSAFNREILFNGIYKIDNINGKSYPVMLKDKIIEQERLLQYPYEKFYRENKDKL
jgi:hypothetical protein